ncbi:MAG TPA: TonB-dependent receptor [Steroidobacteraceae bacterium]|nr:TonB-dependent receptor [Steroidobacteraceae bacterium]
MTRSRRRKLDRESARARAAGMYGVSAVSAAVMAAVAPAQAQTSGGLEEVIVTAQKREESLQNVPLSIQAIGTEKLEQLHVTRFDDYVKYLPSVAYQSIGPGATAVYFRGVASGENSNHSGPVPSVGIYLDEQPITTIQGSLDVRIYDVARVEALAGPQGTLYGASSQAGTIRIITNKPDPSAFAAGFDLEGTTVDGGSEGYSAEGFVNLPINDRAALRLVGWYAQDPGYIDNVLLERTFPTWGGTIDNSALVEEDQNELETYGARAALRIDLNDSWTITPQLMAQEQNTKGSFLVDKNGADLSYSAFKPVGAKDNWYQAALTIEGKLANLDFVYAGSYLDRKVDTDNEYNDYSYYYDVLHGYGAYWYDNNGDFIDPSQYFIGEDTFTKQSHEIRLSSSQDNRVYFVAGLFYQLQKHGIEQNYKIDGLADALTVTGWPDTIWLTQQERRDEDYAAFGEVTFNVNDRLSLTGGVRFFEAESSLKGFFGFSAGYSSGTGEAVCFDPVGINGAPCTNLDKETDESGETIKLNATYRVTEDKLFYVTYSEGFRPGGINRRGNLPPYEADYLENYEFGWKTTWADGRFRFNGALFQQDWDDIQFSYLGSNGLTEIRNAGKAQIRGLEADVSWAVTPALRLTGGLAYIDGELKEDYCIDASACPPPDASRGTQLPVTPEWKGNAIARYQFTLGTFDSFVQGSVVYNGEAWSDLRDADRAVLGKQDAYTIADFSAGIARGPWGLELFVNNVFDERADLFTTSQCSILGPDGLPLCGLRPYSYVAQPRTIGLRYSHKF